MKLTLLGGMLLILLCAPAYGMQPPASQAHNSDAVLTAQADAASTEQATSKADAPASDNATKDDEDEKVYTLDMVEVEKEKHELGKATIGGSRLKSLPSHSGSITEAIRAMSNVQFSNGESSSMTAGEIRPPRISIAGAKPYENNFTIDGMSISNGLNPNGLDGDDGKASFGDLVVNGADQTIFYDTSLIDNITVYSSNVPAQFGDFMGGVVDGELRDPRTDRWHGMMSYQHTRNKWFNQRGEKEGSENADNQPRFSINKYAASADGPINDNVALLAAANRNQSVIPLKRHKNDGTIEDDDQLRRNDNLFAKLMVTPNDALKLTLDATYAPYVEKRWREEWEDSAWEIYNNAWRFATAGEYQSGLGLFTGKLVYSQNGFSRDAENNHREQDGDLMRGSVGDAEWETRSWDASLEWEAPDYDFGSVTYRFSSGLLFTTKTTDSHVEDAQADIMVRRGVRTYLTEASYEETDQSKSLNTYGYYAQTGIEWGRLTLTPGLRIDHDDFSDNTDLAHRFKAEYDTFADGSLRLIGGLNRYYSGKLRSYAFDRSRPAFIHQEFDINGDGAADIIRNRWNSDNSYSADGIDTPYSDEYMGGIAGTALGIEYGVEYVHRDHKKQLISKTEDGDEYYLTNDGSSEYDGITVTLAKAVDTDRFGDHVFTLGATKSKRKTFDGAFDSNTEVNDPSRGFEYGHDQVFYNGDLIDRSDLPADDYNSPVVLTLNWEGSFFEDRFRINSLTRWQDTSYGMADDDRYSKDTPYGTTSGSNTRDSSEWLGPDGKYHDAYEEKCISGGTTSDISFEYDAFKEEFFVMTLELDVFNVFDSTADASILSDDANAERQKVSGRSFYAGVRCEF